MKQTRLGDILLRKQAINKEQLDQAQREMKLNGVSLTAELVKAGLFTEEELAKVLHVKEATFVNNVSEPSVEAELVGGLKCDRC